MQNPNICGRNIVMRVREFDKQVSSSHLTGSVEDHRSMVHPEIFRELAREDVCLASFPSLLVGRVACFITSVVVLSETEAS